MPKLFSFQSTRYKSSAGEKPNAPSEAEMPGGDTILIAADDAEDITQNLETILRQVSHARADADRMQEKMAQLRVEAAMAAGLKEDNLKLAQRLDDTAREMVSEAEKRAETARELSRAEESLSRMTTQLEKANKEASVASLEAERAQDRLKTVSVSLEEAKLELQNQQDARSKAEVEVASLRMAVLERDRTLRSLMDKEAELRLQAEKDRAQLTEITETLGRSQRMLVERKAQCQGQADTISQLEQQCEETSEELRLLEAKHADLKISHDARVYSLNSGLSQEQEGHRITRKLLDEMRASSQVLTDENKYLKDQAVAMAQENQQMKLELGNTRSAIREYSEQLKESHLRYAIAQDDVQRLESAAEKSGKEARTLKRQADKAERLAYENAELQSRITSLQQSLERYKRLGNDHRVSDAPIPLRGRSAASDQRSAGPRLVEKAIPAQPQSS